MKASKKKLKVLSAKRVKVIPALGKGISIGNWVIGGGPSDTYGGSVGKRF
jgi:hypothetical protein